MNAAEVRRYSTEGPVLLIVVEGTVDIHGKNEPTVHYLLHLALTNRKASAADLA